MMTLGERATLVGVLSAVRPELSMTIGSHRGGSLGPVSLYSVEVHAFDRFRHDDLRSSRFPNVTFHIGDSHELLPALLNRLETAGRNVDFALIDGDHSALGVRKDLEDLLSSPSCSRTAILLHDTLNKRVRIGLEQIDFASFAAVQLVDLDFVPGRVMLEGKNKDELWTGLGLVLTGHGVANEVRWPRMYSASEVYEAFTSSGSGGNSTDQRGDVQLIRLEHELAGQRELLKLMERSLSWRVTAPLRAVRRVVRTMSRSRPK